MTGRVFTCDHRVYDLPEPLSWEVVHTGTVPCDSYSVTFLYDRSMAEVLRLAAGFAAIYRGETMLRAIVDEYAVELGSIGLTATITGRGYAARLLDNESRPLTYQDATLAEIVRRHVTPYGIAAGEVADVRASSVYTVPAGVSQWKALEGFCRTYGGFSPGSPGTESCWPRRRRAAGSAFPLARGTRCSPVHCGRTTTAC